MIRYLAAPILAIIYSFSYSAFYELRYDPLHILGFFVGHIALILIISGYIAPRWYDPLITPSRRMDGHIDLGTNVHANIAAAAETSSMEEGDTTKDGKTINGSPLIDDASSTDDAVNESPVIRSESKHDKKSTHLADEK